MQSLLPNESFQSKLTEVVMGYTHLFNKLSGDYQNNFWVSISHHGHFLERNPKQVQCERSQIEQDHLKRFTQEADEK